MKRDLGDLSKLIEETACDLQDRLDAIRGDEEIEIPVIESIDIGSGDDVLKELQKWSKDRSEYYHQFLEPLLDQIEDNRSITTEYTQTVIPKYEQEIEEFASISLSAKKEIGCLSSGIVDETKEKYMPLPQLAIETILREETIEDSRPDLDALNERGRKMRALIDTLYQNVRIMRKRVDEQKTKIEEQKALKNALNQRLKTILSHPTKSEVKPNLTHYHTSLTLDAEPVDYGEEEEVDDDDDDDYDYEGQAIVLNETVPGEVRLIGPDEFVEYDKIKPPEEGQITVDEMVEIVVNQERSDPDLVAALKVLVNANRIEVNQTEEEQTPLINVVNTCNLGGDIPSPQNGESITKEKPSLVEEPGEVIKEGIRSQKSPRRIPRQKGSESPLLTTTQEHKEESRYILDLKAKKESQILVQYPAPEDRNAAILPIEEDGTNEAMVRIENDQTSQGIEPEERPHEINSHQQNQSPNPIPKDVTQEPGETEQLLAEMDKSDHQHLPEEEVEYSPKEEIEESTHRFSIKEEEEEEKVPHQNPSEEYMNNLTNAEQATNKEPHKEKKSLSAYAVLENEKGEFIIVFKDGRDAIIFYGGEDRRKALRVADGFSDEFKNRCKTDETLLRLIPIKVITQHTSPNGDILTYTLVGSGEDSISTENSINWFSFPARPVRLRSKPPLPT